MLEDFQTLAAMTSQFGIDAWYILIDKLDEDERTDGDAAKTAKLVAPLLKNLRILETSHVAFKFFLWNQLRPILVEEKVRLDKVKNCEMSWTRDELRYMINKRLQAYSGGKVQNLTELVDTSLGDKVYTLIIDHAMESPREIVQILDSIFREHARHSTIDNGAIITGDSIERGLDEYASRRVRDLYPPDDVRRITGLPSVKFTNNDVQLRFRISRPTASTRINRWIDNGYVVRVEDERSQKDPSKPVYQYQVSEPRLRRILERRLGVDVGPESLGDAEEDETVSNDDDGTDPAEGTQLN